MRFLAKRTTIAAALLALSMAGTHTGMLAGKILAGDDPPRAGKTSPNWADAIGDRLFASWVEKRVQELQVTAAERRFDDIGWAKDIRDALRLAKRHGRPVFLFSHLGRMATARC
jgi:hypothetical protein